MQPRGDIGGADTVKIKALTAREDGLGNLVDLGGREDEHHMRGRFFQRFQQRVPRVAREHMHLVDDVDAVLGACRRKGDLVDDGADIVDTAVGGGIHLDHVEDLTAVDTDAVRAYAAGIAVVQVKTVDRLGEDLGAGGLARTA